MGSLIWTLALRQLRAASRQSLLASGVVAVGVALVVFLNALIGGLQRRLLETTTGGIPHVVLRPAARQPTPLWATRTSTSGLYVGTQSARQLRNPVVDDWRTWVAWLESLDPQVAVVVPTAEGRVVISREGRQESVTVVGADPVLLDRAYGLQARLAAGRFIGLAPGEAVLGARLADRLGARVRDRIRASSGSGTATLMVAGILRTGFATLDDGVVFVSLRQGQSLLGLGTSVTSLNVRLRRPFEADRVADRIAAATRFEVRSWMRENRQLLSGLQAQARSSFLIQFFAVVASGFGIVSILITNILARLREIGILRALGATRSQVLKLFTLQGLLLSFGGGVAGAALGVALAGLFYRVQLATVQSGVEVFPVDIRPGLVASAVLLSLLVGGLAALFPARQAASVDPIQVIRSL